MNAQHVTVADLSRALGDRSIEAFLLILALPMVVPIPAPGISIAFGIPMMVLAMQLAVGRHQIWLPQLVAKRPIGQTGIARALERSMPTLKSLERLVKPRILWLSGRWSRIPLGLVCFALAAIITLPVPLGHFLPGLAICVLALGLMERDGLVIGTGVCVSLVGLALVLLASVSATRMISLLWH